MTRKTLTKENPANPLLTLGVSIAGLLLLLSLGVFLLPLAAEVLIQNNLSKASALPVKIGKIHFSLTRPQFSIKDLEFSNSKGFPAAPLTRIGEVKVRYLPPATIGGGFELKKVEVDFREFRLVRNKAGSLNLPVLRPLPARGQTIDELVLNLSPVTYTDLSGQQPVQQTFDLKLEKAVYRKVKGVPGILEILNWEILKRTGVEEKTNPPPPEIKPVTELKPAVPQVPALTSSAASKTDQSSQAAK